MASSSLTLSGALSIKTSNRRRSLSLLQVAREVSRCSYLLKASVAKVNILPSR